MTTQWTATRVELTKDAHDYGMNAHYKFRTEGFINETGARFSWTVPDLEGYDISTAEIDPDAWELIRRQDPTGFRMARLEPVFQSTAAPRQARACDGDCGVTGSATPAMLAVPQPAAPPNHAQGDS